MIARAPGRRSPYGFVVVGAAIVVLMAGVSEGGQKAPSPEPSDPAPASSSYSLPAAFSGPPAPMPPDVVSRSPDGQATIRAVRVTTALRLDGQLDEAVYTGVPAISDFIQQEPVEGEIATQKTELWLLFDRENVYISARCWMTDPARLVANEMRRDNTTIVMGNDNLGILIDTFYDRRNGVLFGINAIGGLTDGQITNESQFSFDWNPIWSVKTGRFDNGWTMEAAIPFKSLRYRPGREQIWGFNVKRFSAAENESSFITRIPAGRGPRGMLLTSMAATVVGMEIPSRSNNLEIKPYAISAMTSDVHAVPTVSNDLNGDVGVDVKYGLTQSLMADFTYNTDFAQVEVDEQQVNLTRFSLFFPEKREFFLENQGTFVFGGAFIFAAAGGGGGGGGGGGAGGSGSGGGQSSSIDAPLLFYSRRIGLAGDREVPILAGGRVTGRAGAFSLGLINIQTEDDASTGTPATNFSVLRVKRDILRRSSVGLIATGRSVAQSGLGSNEAYGMDATFGFYSNLQINTYWAQTRTDGLNGEDASYRGQIDYTGDRYSFQAEHLVIGDNFSPEVGFVRRDDMRKSFGLFRFSPRPHSLPSIRKFSGTGSFTSIENTKGRLDNRISDGEFAVEFQNSDRFSVYGSATYEFLPVPFTIAPGVTLPVGGYDYASVRTGYNLGQQRLFSGFLSAEYGTFYDGHKTTVSMSRGRVNVSSQLSIEPTISINWVDLVEGSFVGRLISTRMTYTMSPRMFVSALLQYNSANNSLGSNVRLRWEYRPGSELFVVFNEQRDTLTPRYPDLANRAVVVKINRLFRF